MIKETKNQKQFPMGDNDILELNDAYYNYTEGIWCKISSEYYGFTVLELKTTFPQHRWWVVRPNPNYEYEHAHWI